MSEPSNPGKPGVLRQEVPHRVSVAPGATSALAPSAGPAGPRLRSAAGHSPSSVPGADAAPQRQQASLRRRADVSDGSSTEVRHLAGRKAVNAVFTPKQESLGALHAPAATSAIEQRLSALADLNSNTLKTVTAFEGRVGPQDQPSSAADVAEQTAPEKAPRSLFKRRSS